jgi:hypothetical protein
MISLTADEVERCFEVLGIPNRFTAREKTTLATTTVVDLADFIAFPVPEDNAGLNILNLRKLLGTNPAKQPAFFDHPWYLDEAFGTENISPGWHCLSASPLPDSISQPINYADRLRTRGFELAAAIEVTLMLFLHYAGTGQQLLQKKHTWCRDEASMNRRVTIGAFGRNGLFVSGHPPDFASRGLGICPKLTT